MPLPAGFTLNKPVHPPKGFTLDAPPAAAKSPAELRAAAAANLKPTGELKPAEQGVTPWLENAEADLRGGGSRTLVGKGLGYLQGRGDRGYTGLESGVSKGAAEYMGSLPLGAVHAAQGVATMPQHPIRGGLKAIGGVMEAATIPSSFVGGPAAGKAVELVPSTAYASHLFNLVEHGGTVLDAAAPSGMRLVKGASAIPVKLTRTADEALRAMELGQRGGTPAKPVMDLLERATKFARVPGTKARTAAPPMTYSEARDFYTNLTKLSAEQGASLSGPMKRQIGLVAQALKADIGAAAGQVHQAGNYFEAMRNYAQASKLKRAALDIAKWVGIPTGTAAAAAGAGYLAKKGWELATGTK